MNSNSTQTHDPTALIVFIVFTFIHEYCTQYNGMYEPMSYVLAVTTRIKVLHGVYFTTPAITTQSPIQWQMPLAAHPIWPRQTNRTGAGGASWAWGCGCG